MTLRSKLSLLLGGLVVLSVIFTTALQSRFFTLDQESYVIEMQSMIAMFAARQLQERMTLLHSQVGALVDAGKDIPKIASAIPLCLGATVSRPEPIVNGRVWALEGQAHTAEGGSITWVGRYPKETVRLTFPSEWFGGILEASHGVTSYLLANDGTVLLEAPVRQESISGNSLFPNRKVLSEAFGLPAGVAETRRYLSLDGKRELGTFLPLSSNPPLMIAVATPWTSVEAVIDRTLRQSFWIAVFFLLIAGAIGTLYARSFVAPLQNLVEQTKQLARGDFAAAGESVSRRTDEFGLLARSFETTSRELMKARDTLRHGERLAAFGKFSSSIAHEIKNPLSSILGNTQVARRALGSPEEMNAAELKTAQEALEFVEEETRRANRIINRLLRFARQEQPPSTVIDLSERLQRSIAIIGPTAAERGIALESRLAPGPVSCLADGDQIHEVLLNLFENASYAVKDGAEKRVTVTLENDGRAAVLRIADSGGGIAPEASEHLFEPFFTTKAIGEGTGLGLAVCHGIITNHGGTITVTSEPGKGAEFVIRLPLRDSVEQREAA